tara:strand:+ start:157 stop:303 length:147 start_codon:yes stop_codon:yes gene_type:complete
MDKKKVLKTALTVVAVIVPFGLIGIGSYYGYKAYKKKQAEKDKEVKDE